MKQDNRFRTRGSNREVTSVTKNHISQARLSWSRKLAVLLSGKKTQWPIWQVESILDYNWEGNNVQPGCSLHVAQISGTPDIWEIILNCSEICQAAIFWLTLMIYGLYPPIVLQSETDFPKSKLQWTLWDSCIELLLLLPNSFLFPANDPVSLPSPWLKSIHLSIFVYFSFQFHLILANFLLAYCLACLSARLLWFLWSLQL